MNRPHLSKPFCFLVLSVFFTALCLGTMGAKASVSPGEILMQEAAAYRAEGLQLQATGEYERAASAFRKAVMVNPGYADPYNDLGVVLEILGDFEHAERAYNNALFLNPDHTGAHTNLALLYEKEGKLKRAAQHWNARILLGPPDNPWVLKAQEKIGAYKLPAEDTPQVMALREETRVDMFVEKGRALYKAKDWEGAWEQFQMALKLDPENKVARKYGDRAQKRMARAAQTREADMKEAKVKALARATAAKRMEEEKRRRILSEAEDAAREQVGMRESTSSRRSMTKSAAPQFEVKPSTTVEPMAAKPAPKMMMSKEAEPNLLDPNAFAAEFAREKRANQTDTVDELRRKASGAMRRGDYAEAERVYEQILVLQPDNARIQQALKRAQKAQSKTSQISRSNY